MVMQDVSRVDSAGGLVAARTGSDGLVAFVALAWGTTWLLSLPLVASTLLGKEPQPYRLAMAGLSAFGPSIAAFVVARPRRELREVFGRFHANPVWIVGALLVPLSLHLLARLLDHALGGDIDRWFWLPQTSAAVAALFVFSIGEEFGWRGFAHPRLSARYGPVRGPLLTGLIWGVWHLMYVVKPETGIEPLPFLSMLLQLALWGVVVAWLYERTGRSMAVAIAVHAGAHLDNSAQIPADDWSLQALHLVVLGVVALFCARSLRAMSEKAAEGSRAVAHAP
jgi:membrane protease YdiL (CAAX protease family)